MTDQAFAYFRVPGATSYTIVRASSAKKMDALTDIGESQGFVMVPFVRGKDCPAVLIEAEEIVHREIPAEYREIPAEPDTDKTESNTVEKRDEIIVGVVPDALYAEKFKLFHDMVASGGMRKLVLARTREIIVDRRYSQQVLLEKMFLDTCRAYPELMVMLCHSAETGTWLTATPEPLLEWQDGCFHTVALAGTMKVGEGDWSEKNRKEQQVVADFIRECVSEFSDVVTVEGPNTSEAGLLVHLKTDIRFAGPASMTGDIVSRLHPTPAVCGLPQKKALDFIKAHEGTERRYYSGFAGPVGIDGHTRLFVSLRCAEIDAAGGKATLYAGGGIMPESNCASEFVETEHKMHTIERCIP